MSKSLGLCGFLERCIKKHDDKYDYSNVEYKSVNDKVKIICPIHGEFEMTPKSHLNGCGCYKCSYLDRMSNNRKSLGEFIEESNEIHNKKYDYSKFKYKNAKTKGLIICPIHGEFSQCPNDHLNGKGCPKCKQSHLERDIEILLIENNIQFEYQKKFKWLGKQSLDFYLPQYNIAIECQGKQHLVDGSWSVRFNFIKQIKSDAIKNRLCYQYGVKLIYYINNQYFNKIKTIDIYNKENVFYNKNDLVNYTSLKEGASWTE